MPFSAGWLGALLRGVALTGLLALVASCTKTTVAGVMLHFVGDPTLNPDTLDVTITADGQTPYVWCYRITNSKTFFPTTLGIGPTADPTETVSVTASILQGAVTLDTQQDYITEVPNNRVVDRYITFRACCSKWVSPMVSPPTGNGCDEGAAPSLCPPRTTCGETCTCERIGGPLGDLPDASTQLPDAGSTESPDATFVCPNGEGICSSVCVDEQTDTTNCGACGNVCQDGTICQGGSCVCPATEVLCGAGGAAACANPLTDLNNCGGCGVTCEAGQVCQRGACGPPSCAPGGPGMTNCGPGGSGTESCCTSLEVEGGTYYRTYDVDGGNFVVAADGGPTNEADPATVSGFRLDKYLVTVGRFRQFVNAVLPADGGPGWLPLPESGKHTHLNGGLGLVNVDDDAGSPYEPGWMTSDDSNVAPTDTNLMAVCGSGIWTHTADSHENLPINCVNWYEAYAFCIWDGGFLPSEAEWEYAAAAGSQQREYPWGATNPGTSNQYTIYDCYYPNGSNDCEDVNAIAPVGYASQGVGLWGQLDLSGDVYGWSLDWYVPSYFDPCTDCAVVTATSGASERVARGDSFDGQSVQSWQRNDYDPHDRDSSLGFRCARLP